jgi:hypothetical protein
VRAKSRVFGLNISYRYVKIVRTTKKGLVLVMEFAYLTISAITAGVIGAANRATGLNYFYTTIASALWPAWWLRYTFTEEA